MAGRSHLQRCGGAHVPTPLPSCRGSNINSLRGCGEHIALVFCRSTVVASQIRCVRLAEISLFTRANIAASFWLVASRGNAHAAPRLRHQHGRLAALATKMLTLAASGAPAHGGATAPGGGTGDRGGVSSNSLRRPGHSEDGYRCHRHAHARRARREAARCGHAAAAAARRGPDDLSACGGAGQRDAAMVSALCHVRRLPAAAHGLRRTARHQTPVGCRRDRTLSGRCSTSALPPTTE
jgi:hypothetical protein